jgi:hypothetical protein
MSSLEATLDSRTEAAPEPVVGPTPERPVFAATSGTRPRALKLFGRVAAGLVGLWLVALVLGALGLGQVAGITLPTIGGGDDHPSKAEAAAKAERDAAAPHISAASLTARGPAGRRVSTNDPARSGGRTSASPTARRTHSGTGRAGSSSQGSNQGGATTSTGTSQLGTATPAPGSSSTAPGQTGSTPSSSSGSANSAPSSSPSPHASPNATPPGSSSTDPGSRSQAGTAPGRTSSSATPTPGSGSTDHGRPAG